MLRVLIINVILLVVTAVFTYLQTLLATIKTSVNQGIVITILIVAFFLTITWLLLTSNTYLMEHHWKNSISKKKLKTIFWSSAKPGVAFGALTIGIVLLSFISLQFYSSFNGLLAPLAIGLLLFAFFLYALSAQYMLPIYRLQNNSIRKSLKKAFLIAVDNPGFSLLLLLSSVLLLVVSTFTAFLFPGIAGVSYLFCCATKLRLLKYDAENPQKPNWDQLLAEERQRTGSRSFISFIFPWK